MPWLIVGGALAIWLLLQRQSAATVAVPQTTPGAAAGAAFSGVVSSKPPASIPSPTSGGVAGALAKVQGLSNAGCTAIASSKGVPSSLASTGCSVFGYLTPIGAASAALKYAPPALTYVGTKTAAAVVTGAKDVASATVTAAKATGNAIETGASGAYHAIASIF